MPSNGSSYAMSGRFQLRLSASVCFRVKAAHNSAGIQSEALGVFARAEAAERLGHRFRGFVDRLACAENEVKRHLHAEYDSLSKRPVRTAFSRQSKPVILEEWEVREARKF
jgi:hypothetical protein